MSTCFESHSFTFLSLEILHPFLTFFLSTPRCSALLIYLLHSFCFPWLWFFFIWSQFPISPVPQHSVCLLSPVFFVDFVPSAISDYLPDRLSVVLSSAGAHCSARVKNTVKCSTICSPASGSPDGLCSPHTFTGAPVPTLPLNLGLVSTLPFKPNRFTGKCVILGIILLKK